MNPSDVQIYLDPYAPGMSVLRYEAPMKADEFVPRERLEEGLDALLEAMQRHAYQVNCNAILGAEFEMDPFAAGGCSMSGRGTPAELKPLFGGSR